MIRPMPATKKSATHGGIGHVFNKLTSEIGDPVDFELPDWLSKWEPTPNPYTSIRRNIYLTNKGKRRQKDDGISCLCSSTAESSDVCGTDCLCSILWSSCTSRCKCGGSCLNKAFHQRPIKKMKLVKKLTTFVCPRTSSGRSSIDPKWDLLKEVLGLHVMSCHRRRTNLCAALKTEKCGTGIVADEDIKRKEFVIEYVGEVIDDKTCEERLWKMKHSGETNFYLCEISKDMVIDATYKGNKSRYINHSCCPNTEMQQWTIDGETRIGIFAKRDISRGEHLTYDYQFVQFGADQDCRCGSIKCKQKLGVKPNKPKPPPSDAAALQLVASQVAASYPKEKALLSAQHDYQTEVPPKGNWSCNPAWKIQHPRNCIGQIIRIIRSSDQSRVDSLESQIPDVSSSFGIIKKFDSISKKHLITFEDASVEHVDLSKEDWEFCNSA